MAGPHVMIVIARFYDDLADEQLRGATIELEKAGATYEVFNVPGALEIPAAIRIAVRAMDFPTVRPRFDGYVALGCVIRGETTHYDIVSNESARGLTDLALRFTLAIGNGILTVEDEDQAWARARVDGSNKAGGAARACLDMIEIKRQFGLFPR